MEYRNQVTVQKAPVSDNIYIGDDGIIRWMYEFRMMKNPVILFTVWKVLGMAAAIIAVFLFVISRPDVIRYGFSFSYDLSQWKIPVILLAVFFVISILAYVIVAASYGWSYMVLFEMSDKEIICSQMPKDVKKAQAMGFLLMISGIKTGNITQVGQGMMVASKTQSTSEFENVRVIKLRKRRNTIFVNQRLFHNQVYTAKEDFDFVADYIIQHCPNARVKGK